MSLEKCPNCGGKLLVSRGRSTFYPSPFPFYRAYCDRCRIRAIGTTPEIVIRKFETRKAHDESVY